MMTAECRRIAWIGQRAVLTRYQRWGRRPPAHTAEAISRRQERPRMASLYPQTHAYGRLIVIGARRDATNV